jgi:RNA polymerase sigma-70 factor, ECF subfamily
MEGGPPGAGFELNGDPRAFEELLEPHVPTLLSYSRFLCSDHHLAQDVVQEAALIAYRNLHRFFPDADFASWLKAIVRHRALCARKKRARQADLRANIGKAFEEAYHDPTPEALETEREILQRCLISLQERDERSALLVQAYYFGGQALARVASEMKINLNTAKTWLHRSRQVLHECLKRHLRAANA